MRGACTDEGGAVQCGVLCLSMMMMARQPQATAQQHTAEPPIGSGGGNAQVVMAVVS